MPYGSIKTATIHELEDKDSNHKIFKPTQIVLIVIHQKPYFIVLKNFQLQAPEIIPKICKNLTLTHYVYVKHIKV